MQAVTGLGCREVHCKDHMQVSGMLLLSCPLQLQVKCTAVGQVDNPGERRKEGMTRACRACAELAQAQRHGGLRLAQLT